MLGNETLSRAPKSLQTEADAYAFLEGLRWGEDGPTTCPHCGSTKGAWYLKPKDPEGRKSKGGSSARSQRRVWKCRENTCRRQFSVLTNTVLHATKMPVRAWIGAIVDLCEDPAGVSARDISARWGITEKSAWAMLNRVQEALGEPEVAGAELQSNAPLWFEIDADEAQVLQQERHDREAAAALAAERKQQADREAAERIERDVQRALGDVEAAEPGPDVGAESRAAVAKSESTSAVDLGVAAVGSGSAIASKAAAEVVEAGSDFASKAAADFDVEAPAAAASEVAAPGSEEPVLDLIGSTGDASESHAGGVSKEVNAVVSSPDLAAEAPSKTRDVDVDEQVKSDVERALAEVFGDALPPEARPKEASEKAPTAGAGSAPKARVAGQIPASAEQNSSPIVGTDSPRQPGADAAVREEPVAASASESEQEPATPLGKTQSSAVRKKRKKRAKDRSPKLAKRQEPGRPQPVDKSESSDREQSPQSRRPTADGMSRAQARRERKQRKDVAQDRVDLPVESLGAGWLDKVADEAREAPPQVSSNQGKLDGIPAPDLGPSWASMEPEVSSETPQNDHALDNQLNFFDDQDSAAE